MTYINIVVSTAHDSLFFPPKFLLVMEIPKICHITFEWTFLNGDTIFVMEYQQKNVASHNDPTFKLTLIYSYISFCFQYHIMLFYTNILNCNT